MPFTISHAAAILPFSRFLARWRLLSATLIGSMVPDFGLFSPWRWRPARFETHSLDGLITFCLPVGLATYWLFQRLIKTPLLQVLPPGAYARWRETGAPADYRSLRQWILAACGILAGAFTHLVWDGFTHEGGRGLRMLPALEEPAVQISGHRLGGTYLLQDANSLIGLIVVFAVVAYSLRPGKEIEASTPRRLQARERYLWVTAYVLAAAALSGLFLLMKYRPPPGVTGLTAPISSAAIATLRGLGFALVGTSVCLTLRLRKSSPGPPA